MVALTAVGPMSLAEVHCTDATPVESVAAEVADSVPLPALKSTVDPNAGPPVAVVA